MANIFEGAFLLLHFYTNFSIIPWTGMSSINITLIIQQVIERDKVMS